jgi:ketosteroid isomerase-like protein
MTTAPATNSPATDIEALARLNQAYIEAVLHNDVAQFEGLLADDFLCTAPDGTLLDRAAFLAHTATAARLRALDAHDVDIRLIGEVAIIHARTTFERPDGTSGTGRYTDIWAKRGGCWLAVAAHVTRRS